MHAVSHVKVLHSISRLTLCLGFGLATAADTATSLSPEIIDRLVEKAADWQIPQPAAEAKLIKMWAYRSDKEYYSLGFVDPASPKFALIGLPTKDITRGTEIIRIDNPST